MEPAVGEEGAERQLDARRIAQRSVPGAALLQALHQSVARGVFVAEPVDLGVGDLVLERHQVAEPVAVDRHAEANLGLDLVALGDGDLAHVVAEPRDLHVLRVVPGGGGAHPHAKLRVDRRLAPVPDDHFAAASEAARR